MNRPLAVPPVLRPGRTLPPRRLCPAARAGVPDADFRDLQATFERLHADWTSRGGRTEAMDAPHFYNPELLRWLLHLAVLDLVEPIPATCAIPSHSAWSVAVDSITWFRPGDPHFDGHGHAG